MKRTYFLIGFLTLVLFSVVGFGTYFISSSYAALDAQVLASARDLLTTKSTLSPIEGSDTNIINMTQSSLADTKASSARISVASSSTTQISSNGTITYGDTPVTATVVLRIRRGHRTTTQRVTIMIPARTSTESSTAATGTNNTSTSDGTTSSGTSTGMSSGTTPTTLPTPITKPILTPTPMPTPTPIPAPIPTPTPTNTVPAGALNVKNYGAKGDGATNDTTAINSAITAAYNKGGGTVWVPNGTYMINMTTSDVGINMKSKVILQLSTDAILKATASSSVWYAIVYFQGINDAAITGGKIIGDRDIHTGTNGEWGMGINITGSNNIKISSINISNCWGDGIYVGGSSSQNYSQNITIENFDISYNRRDGISIISAKDLIIKNGTTSYSTGTNPQSGIILEPNVPTEFMQNILITNVYSHHNGLNWQAWYCYGIGVAFGHYEYPVNNYSITITNSRLVDNGRDYDNEQMNYNNINQYKNDARWSGKGTITYSGITYTP